MISVYDYIASQDPYGAVSVIKQFGYRITDPSNMGSNLRSLVANEGEPALRSVMNLHPDKEAILEIFSNENSLNGNCSSCQFLNASGITQFSNPFSQKSESEKYSIQTNTIIMMSALILSTAIILKN